MKAEGFPVKSSDCGSFARRVRRAGRLMIRVVRQIADEGLRAKAIFAAARSR